jgi:serine phosphatase RsbU (regulator of sigma subunit)
VSCGHPAPLLITGDSYRLLSPQEFAPPLGLLSDVSIHSYHLQPGDRVLLYTDGLLESRNGAGEFFRLDAEIGTLRRAESNDALVESLLQRLREHAGRDLDDDVALLVMQVSEAAPVVPTAHDRLGLAGQ